MSESVSARFRWWPAVAILAIAVVAYTVIKSIESWPYEQARSFAILGVVAVTSLLLIVWWLFLSRLGWGIRLLGLVVFLALPPTLFRYRGMSGDFVPIYEFRFAKGKSATAGAVSLEGGAVRSDYPQLFGPTRDGNFSGPVLSPDWNKTPPQLVWKQPIGAAWSGFVVAGDRALTQEQDGENECVSCYEVTTGKTLWKTTNPAHYESPIAGVGPRATPTIVGDRVVTLGALGTLQCLDLSTGRPHWKRDMAADAGAKLPEWGFASSPLVHDGKVIVSAGGSKSLLAYRLDSGEIAWTGGTRPANYSSPFLLTVAGRPQIVMFNSQAITAHDPATGAVLWEWDWGRGMPHVSRPIPFGDRQIFFSSGYGVGSALLELTPEADGKFKVDQVWKTPRFQSKFAMPVERNGYVYGVSDGIFACLDLRDGSVKWKEGRYGHGQGLMIGDFYLQMTEQPGDLVLLKPTPEAPHELARFPLFEDKTWNPIALTGDLLLARTDREAACVRLPTVSGKR
jgi:outer membrane protein assembly factor BamB